MLTQLNEIEGEEKSQSKEAVVVQETVEDIQKVLDGPRRISRPPVCHTDVDEEMPRRTLCVFVVVNSSESLLSGMTDFLASSQPFRGHS